MKLAALALGIAVVAGGCASKGTAAADQAPTATSSTRRTNVISQQEINESRATSLNDLIRQLRPGWRMNVAIFLNNDPDPSGTALNRSPSTVRQINFLSKSEAQIKWGSRYDEVIQIITK